MSDDEKLRLIQISASLRHLFCILSDWQFIDEKQPDLNAPGFVDETEPPHSAEFALENVRHLMSEIAHIETLSEPVAGIPSVRRVLELLVMIHDQLGQVDVPAEFLIGNSRNEEAVNSIREAFKRAADSCSQELLAANAAISIDARHGCADFGNVDPDKLTGLYDQRALMSVLGIPEHAARAVEACLERLRRADAGAFLEVERRKNQSGFVYRIEAVRDRLSRYRSVG